MSSERLTWGLRVVIAIDWLMASELEHENKRTAGTATSCSHCGKDQVALLHHSNMKEPLLKPQLWLLSTAALIKHLSNFKAPSSSTIFSLWCFITSLMVFWGIPCWQHSLCICVMCTVLWDTCVPVAWALLPLHSDRCCRFDQACWAACGMPTLSSGTVGTKCWNRWDWSGRLHRERPIPQSEAPPIEDNDPQLGPPAGREEGRVAVGSVKAERMGRDERGCGDPKISKRSRKWLKMLEEQVAVRKSGQHTVSIWFFLCSLLGGDERLCSWFWFFCPNKKSDTVIVLPRHLITH